MNAVKICVVVLAIGVAVSAQGSVGLDPAKLLKPGTDTWPTYNGDYSGRRYSPLAQITAANVKALSLAWIYQLPASNNPTSIKSTPLLINGVHIRVILIFGPLNSALIKNMPFTIGAYVLDISII